MHIRPRTVEKRKGERLTGHLGVYYYETKEAHVFLGPLLSFLKKRLGDPVPEQVLREEIVNTIVHETLHSLVRSCGPNWMEREHRAIARLMAKAGLSWRY